MQRLLPSSLSHVPLLYLRRNLKSEMTFCAPESRNMQREREREREDVALGLAKIYCCPAPPLSPLLLSVNRRNYSDQATQGERLS